MPRCVQVSSHYSLRLIICSQNPKPTRVLNVVSSFPSTRQLQASLRLCIHRVSVSIPGDCLIHDLIYRFVQQIVDTQPVSTKLSDGVFLHLIALRYESPQAHPDVSFL